MRFRLWMRKLVPPYKRYRFARLGLYVSLCGVGVLCFALRLPLLTSLLGGAVFLNGLFLVVGSVIAATGYVRDHPSLEVVGYPLLITAMSIFSLVLFIDKDPKPTTLLLGLVFLALTFGLYGRSRDIRSEIKIYDRLSERYGPHDDAEGQD